MPLSISSHSEIEAAQIRDDINSSHSIRSSKYSNGYLALGQPKPA